MTNLKPGLLKLRQAVPSKAKALSALAYRSKAFWNYSDAFMANCRNELTYCTEQLLDLSLHFYVAESAQKIIGFYALKTISNDTIELEALFVEPKYIGTGVGRQLFDHAKNLAAKLGATDLIIQSDPNAEGFYIKAGAINSGQRESENIPGRYLTLLKISLNSNCTGFSDRI